MWKQEDIVLGYKLTPGKYEFSDSGEVRNAKTKKKYKINDTSIGYMYVSLSMENGDRKNVYIHRIVHDVFISDVGDKVVDHKDYNTKNNNISNLRAVTQKNNIHHSIQGGRFKSKGSENIKSKLTELDVEKICIEFERNNFNYSDILKKLNLSDIVTTDTLTKIRRGKQWTHVSSNFDFDKGEDRVMNTLSHLKNSIIKLINEGNSVKDIADNLNIDISDTKAYNRLRKYISRYK